MRFAIVCAVLFGLAAGSAPAGALDREALQAALAAGVGEDIELTLPMAEDRSASVRLRRVEVYAEGARIYESTANGLRELPRSDWRHFRPDPDDAGAPRLSLSLSADGGEAAGLLIADDGRSLAIVGERAGEALELRLLDARKDLQGRALTYACGNPSAASATPQALTPRIHGPEPEGAASRSAAIAVDTDNELMQLKFANDTTAANNYLAQLFAAMNVVYERDLDLSLLQGTTILRTAPDPYAAAGGAQIAAQLDEFEAFWAANQGGVARAFAMLLSGKSVSPNSSSGFANILVSPAVNYCSSTAVNGHYSVTQVFRFAGSNASHDLLVIAHEIGHNFGAFHSHCSNSSTGIGPASSSTIDQCSNVEAGLGCFGGTQVCPAPATVNGVANVRGTLMSYCHLNGIAGCTSGPVFATAHRTLLTPRVANNVTLGCFTGNAGPNIFANGFE